MTYPDEPYEPYEPFKRKVHMFQDQKGAKYSSMGRKLLYADTVCRGNYRGPDLVSTRDPRLVTCKTCIRKMRKERIAKEDKKTKFRATVEAFVHDYARTPIASTLMLMLIVLSLYLRSKGYDERADHALILAFLVVNGRPK